MLARFLSCVHSVTEARGIEASLFPNDQMRRLHGDHILLLPFRDNDFGLSPAVEARAESIRADSELVRGIDELYRSYLEPRGSLVHADVQSSNVLLAASGPVLLDAEIAHVGDRAFDVGTLVAHVFLPAVARGEVAGGGRTARKVWSAYLSRNAKAAGDRVQVDRYAAVEMLRRTIGAARVPVMQEDSAALACIDLALAVFRSERSFVA